MKKNKGLKIAAAIIFTLAILVAGACAVLIAMIGVDKFNRANAHAFYNECFDQLVSEQESKARDYYMLYVQSEENSEMNHYVTDYKNDFAEENSNYFFRITPTDSDKYKGLANYYTNKYQYHTITYHEDEIYRGTYELNCKILLSDIIDKWKDVSMDVFGTPAYKEYDTDLYDGYYQDDYSADSTELVESPYENNPNYGSVTDERENEIYLPIEIVNQYGDWGFISGYDVFVDYQYGDLNSAIENESLYLILGGTNFRYNLMKDPLFKKEYGKMLEKLDGADMQCVGVSYDGVTGNFNLSFEEMETVTYELESFVKTELTAHDSFRDSIILKYSKSVTSIVPVAFFVSAILIIVLAVYLILAAGHRKGEETIVYNSFDKIPVDLFAYYYMILVATWYSNIYGLGYSVWDELLLTAFFGTAGAIMAAPAIMTIATRFKVDGIGLLKNTLVWKIVLLCKRICIFIWKKIKKICSVLGTYFNLYWKWLGVFAVLQMLVVVVWVSAQPEFAFFVMVLCDLFVAYMLIKTIRDLYILKKGAEIIAKGDMDYTIDTTGMTKQLVEHGENLNNIRDGIKDAVEERMKSERMKTELITNVSHDIKTPLTSIISYVDLISKEEGLSEKQQEYIEVLQRQSARLKKLIEDLIEASKASTGNLEVHPEKMDVEMLIGQIVGEYESKFAAHGLRVVTTNHMTDTQTGESLAYVVADGRHLWRVVDNLMGNIVKYAQENSRVYIDVESAKQKDMLQVVFKNISREALNISGDELMERFVRGDRSRNTEGSGLGLSIAKNLIELQGGKVEIMIDGDLFKVVLLLKV